MAWGILAVFLLLIASILSLVTDDWQHMLVAGTVVVVGSIVALFRDRSMRCAYLVEDDRVVMRSGRLERTVGMSEVRDVSLVDATAAREYLRQRLRTAIEHGASVIERRTLVEGLLRFCPLDLRLAVAASKYLPGRRKRDLVLLRTVDGGEHLLAPVYPHDMVAVIDKVRSALRRA